MYKELNILTVKKLFYKTKVTFFIKYNQIKLISHDFNIKDKLNNTNSSKVHTSTT
jgi:hypothetical protein